MKKIFYKKVLIIGIISILFLLIVSPELNAIEYNKLYDSENNVDNQLYKLTVKEYKSDGSFEKYFVELTKKSIDEFKEKLNQKSKIEDRLEVYKEFGLISNDVTADKLKTGMEEKTIKNGITKEELEKIKYKSNLAGIHRNSMCSIIVGGVGFAFQIGLSIFTKIYNWFWVEFVIGIAEFSGVDTDFLYLLLLPSADIIAYGLCPSGQIDTDGLNGHLYDSSSYPYGSMYYRVLGFVGYTVALPLGGPHYLDGFATSVFAIIS